MKLLRALLAVALLAAPAWAQDTGMPGVYGRATGNPASLLRPGQVMRGGARMRSVCAMGQGEIPLPQCIPASGSTVTVDPSNGPMQYLENNAAFTLKCPAYPFEGSIFILLINGSSAGTVTISGCTVGSSTGASLTTVNTSQFTISMWSFAVPGALTPTTAGYNIFAHQ